MAYKSFLKGLQGDDPSIAPQFKTWFYIYQNNTVRDEFRDSIRENYFVEVKDVERVNIVDDEPTATVAASTDSDLSYVEDARQNAQTTKNNDTTNSKDIPDFETLKKTQPLESEDQTRLIDDQVDSSKFDAVVEDRQYVEVPVIKEEMLNEPVQDDVKSDLKEEEVSADDKKPLSTLISASSVKEVLKEAAKKAVKEASMEAIKEADNLEIMKAEARNLDQRQFGSTNAGEVASALSGNSIVGKKDNSRQSEKNTESKMLLFNGLYYKGNWAIPFQVS